MGVYLNPGNSGFAEVLKSRYIDKTGLIELMNETIGTLEKLICVSRPRRFGKSLAAKMLCAYYDCTCDSHNLFNGLEISQSEDYEKYINQYNVICLDVASFISDIKSDGRNIENISSDIKDAIKTEVQRCYPKLSGFTKLNDCLMECVKLTGRKFIFVIDEWDCVIRESKSALLAWESFLNVLRGWFKNANFTPQVVAAAYMTGILPIKKDGSQSAISDFEEYTILDPGPFAKYTGFTESEVRELCNDYGMNFEDAKRWYDGYSFEPVKSIYNPYSVMTAMRRKSYQSYWQKTSVAEALITYINMNFEGLQEDIVRLIAGEQLEVNTNGFKNDFQTFHSKNDVLTLLIHLGYLAYDKEENLVRIPNGEIRSEFNDLIENAQYTKLAGLVETSKQLLADTLAGNEKAVAKGIEAVRDSNYAPLFYNNEQALRYVIKFAYIVCVDRYLKVEELPSGKGVADVVFIPKKRTADPAIVIELKWNKTLNAAIEQIKQKNYPSVFNDYDGDILLVGIHYDEKTKLHTCEIEKMLK